MEKIIALSLAILAFSCSQTQKTPAPGLSVTFDGTAVTSGFIYRFYDVIRGGTSTAKILNINNSGDADLIINGIAKSGTNTNNFVISNAPSYPLTLASGQSTNIQVYATFPSCTNYSAIVTIDGAAAGSQSFMLLGSGAVFYHTFESSSTFWVWGTGSDYRLINVQKRSGASSLYFYSGEINNSGIGIQCESNSWDYNIDPDSVNNAITFWVYDTGGNNTVYFNIFSISGTTTNSHSIWTSGSSVQNQWTKMKVYFTNFTSFNPQRINRIELGEYWSGTYYIDDIQVVNE